MYNSEWKSEKQVLADLKSENKRLEKLMLSKLEYSINSLPKDHPIRFGRWLLKYAKEGWVDNALCWEHEGKHLDTHEIYELYIKSGY